MENKKISFLLGETIELEVNQKAICLDEDLEITIKNIIIEEIAAAPENEENYPAGSGVTVNLIIRKGIDSQKILLTKLSKGYESKIQEIWKEYVITLINASNKAKLNINSNN